MVTSHDQIVFTMAQCTNFENVWKLAVNRFAIAMKAVKWNANHVAQDGITHVWTSVFLSKILKTSAVNWNCVMWHWTITNRLLRLRLPPKILLVARTRSDFIMIPVTHRHLPVPFSGKRVAPTKVNITPMANNFTMVARNCAFAHVRVFTVPNCSVPLPSV